jgi:hypothetical protein
VPHGAVARLGHAHAAGLRLGGIDKIGQGLERRILPHHQHHRLLGNRRDRTEILQRIERHLRVQGRIDRQVRRLPHADGVAVRRRLGHHIQPDVAAGAGLVVHDHRPSQQGGELLGDQARSGVGATAGRERHDEADRFGRPGGLRESTGHRSGHGSRENMASLHPTPPLF